MSPGKVELPGLRNRTVLCFLFFSSCVANPHCIEVGLVGQLVDVVDKLLPFLQM